MPRWDHIVIGGGIAGTSAAYHLARLGRHVLLLERASIGDPPPTSSSGDEAKIFRSAYGSDRHMTRLTCASRRWWEIWEHQAGEELLTPRPMVVFGDRYARATCAWPDRASASWAAESAAVLASSGVPCDLLSPEEAVAQFPAIVPEVGATEALVDWSAGILHAARSVRAVAHLAVAAGVELREEATVSVVSTAGEGMTRLAVDGEEVQSRHGVVFAAGAQNLDLVPELAAKAWVSSQPVIHLGVDPMGPPVPLGDVPIVVSLRERVYVYPVSVSTLLIADDDPQRGAVHDPHEAFVDRATGYVSRHLRAVAGRRLVPRSGRRCHYTNASDGRYILYRSGDAVVVSACSGHGFKNGPVIGLLAAQLATGTQLELPIERFIFDAHPDLDPPD